MPKYGRNRVHPVLITHHLWGGVPGPIGRFLYFLRVLGIFAGRERSPNVLEQLSAADLVKRSCS